MAYRYILDLQQEATVQAKEVVSRLLHHEGGVRTRIFAFDAGQELAAHSAAHPAILQILSGQGRLKLGEAEHEAKPGTWVYMPAGLVHAIRAESPLTLLLISLPKE
ncbi:MAG: cupin domain-containing protein [Thermaceae bacterium]|nr:cupin domain-containing protein [Thermaceae bacterium]